MDWKDSFGKGLELECFLKRLMCWMEVIGHGANRHTVTVRQIGRVMAI